MVECYQPLADSQWPVIAPLLPLYRKRRPCLCLSIGALRYICRTGWPSYSNEVVKSLLEGIG